MAGNHEELASDLASIIDNLTITARKLQLPAHEQEVKLLAQAQILVRRAYSSFRRGGLPDT